MVNEAESIMHIRHIITAIQFYFTLIDGPKKWPAGNSGASPRVTCLNLAYNHDK